MYLVRIHLDGGDSYDIPVATRSRAEQILLAVQAIPTVWCATLVRVVKEQVASYFRD